MKLKYFFLLIGVLLISSTGVLAQGRAERTASARAYYGDNGYSSAKKAKKKQKPKKYSRRKAGKGTRADRDISPWRRRAII
jgi:hypothetical protein